MLMKKYFVGIIIAACAASAASIRLDAQAGTPERAPGSVERNLCWPEMKTKEAQTLVARAKELAGNDLVWEAQDACLEGGPAREPDNRPRMQTLVEPLRVFDNLYFVGFEQIGTWTLRTSDGLILFDTLNNPIEAETVLEPGLRKLGLNPADIRYIILSHGHRDHYGGATYFQQKYPSARVMMTAADWDLIYRPPAARRGGGGGRGGGRGGTPVPVPLPKRDLEITDGQKLTLGDTTVTFGIYPGHTPGTIMNAATVMDKGVRRIWLIPGGALQVPNRASLQAFEHIINDYFKPLRPEMFFNSHPQTMNDGVAQMNQIRKNPNGPNPLVYGQERGARLLDIWLACRRAWVVEKEPGATN
jgi:metallo-beta-lactamase class B